MDLLATPRSRPRADRPARPLCVYLCGDVYQAADRFNINRQWEHLQAKYVGTGHADTTKLCVRIDSFVWPARTDSSRCALIYLLQ